jgi:hypothetical protein
VVKNEENAMTSQVTDTVKYKGKNYELIGSSRGELLFNIYKLGLYPDMISTACYRGFYCEYELTEKGLFLRKLTVRDGSGNYPRIGTVKPKIEEYQAVYKKLDIKVRLSGKFRIARGFIQKYYIHMGYQKASAFRNVIDFSLSRGKIININDRSAEIKKIRGLYKKYYDKGNIIANIETAFSLDPDIE